eukprot:GHVQ01027388.1.p1 GENE.GHVQ01027388.1~~GHVQ01027388.1.p1  ORF type:complete len:244 (+),score=36.90 GHVQ01027388.1:179-910(+)
MSWKQILLATGGAVAAGAVVYYLLREEPAALHDPKAGDKDKKKINVQEITRDQVLEILHDIIKSQDKMKTIMKQLTKELIKDGYSFQMTYDRVKEVQPEDPLERYGVSMNDFDQLLDRYQHEPNIRDAIARIMGAPQSSTVPPKVHSITKATVVKVHGFMLAELKKLVEEFQRLPNKSKFDMKTVTIAAQALVGARVEEQFQLTSEDIEAAVLMHHQQLASDGDFARINVLMQSTMAQLMGTA